jgi:hypothetical protein
MNRRIFIQQVSLLSGSLFLSMQGLATPFPQRNQQIKGKVTDGRRGIANVVVSDGYTVTVTDKRGNYSMDTHDQATLIWLSTPAGYEFLAENSIARHYYTLDGRAEYDFELKRLNQKDEQHHFIIWADPQVRNKKDVKQMMETSVPDTIATIAALGKEALVHGICVGDLIWDFQEYFSDYDAAVGMMGIPFFQTLGNHDMDYRQGGDETSDRTFKKKYGPTYYSFNRGKAHYVVLDDVRYLGNEREYDGFITAAQLSWLAKDLAHVAKDQLLIISTHIPVYNGVKNNAEFYTVLAGFNNVHIMTGHTHYHVNHIDKGIFEHNHGTVCGAWWTGPICEDGTPRGYGVYEVKGTALSWYYKSTGLPKEHQIKLYIDQQASQPRFIANIWNYDPEWKIAYFLDDKPMGLLKSEPEFDPLSVTLYKGDQLPAGRHFPEPKETVHLFSASIYAGVKQVRVVATDRFGKTYQAEATVAG